MEKIMQIGKRFMDFACTLYSVGLVCSPVSFWPLLMKRIGKSFRLCWKGGTGVILGDRNYWLPNLQVFLRTKSILLQAPFRKARSPKAAAYHSLVLGCVRYLIDTAFG